MSKRIRLDIAGVSVDAELHDNPTARALGDALPLTGTISMWGDELFFSTDVQAELADEARVEMEVGDIAYWPPGHAVCVFFGRTPASEGDQPRAASPVNPVGKLLTDPDTLKNIADGDRVNVYAAD
jgi:hypothetical protein